MKDRVRMRPRHAPESSSGGLHIDLFKKSFGTPEFGSKCTNNDKNTPGKRKKNTRLKFQKK